MRRLIPAALLVVTLGAPALANAQSRQPAEGAVAVGGAAGLFIPSEDALENALYLEGQFRYHFTPRVGLRFGVGWTNPGFDRESDDTLRQIRIGADLLYNWEHGKWHPYAGAGFGVHLLQQSDNGRDIGDGESEPGGSLLGGVEYFFTRDAVVSGEARYQFVGDIGGISPSGFLLLGGLTKYF